MVNVRHWAPQYCHCSLAVTAPVYEVVAFHNMTEAAGKLIVDAVADAKRKTEVREFIRDRMDTNHDTKAKQTSATTLAHKVRHTLCPAPYT